MRMDVRYYSRPAEIHPKEKPSTLHLGHLADAFVQIDKQPFMHTFTHTATQGDSQSEAVRDTSTLELGIELATGYPANPLYLLI